MTRPAVLNIFNARADCAGESSRRKGIKIDPKGRSGVLSIQSESAQRFSIAFGQADRQAPIRIARLRKLVPKILNYGSAHYFGGTEVRMRRQPGREIKSEAIETDRFQALPQNSTKLRQAGANLQLVRRPPHADSVGERVALIQGTTGRPAEFQKLVILQLLHSNQHADSYYQQNRGQRGAARIQKQQAKQAEARADAVKQQHSLSVRNSFAQQFMVNMLAIGREQALITQEPPQHGERYVQNRKSQGHDGNRDGHHRRRLVRTGDGNRAD